MIPKFHWLLHIADHLRRFGCLPTCWVHERKHRVAKRYATGISNTQKFERSLLGEIISHNLAAYVDDALFDLSVRLVQPHKASARVRKLVAKLFELSFGDSELFTGSRIHIVPAGFASRGDVVLAKSADNENFICGDLCLNIWFEEMTYTIILPFETSAYDRNNGFADWKKAKSSPVMLPSRDVLCPCTHSILDDGGVRTLIPLLYRPYKPVNE